MRFMYDRTCAHTNRHGWIRAGGSGESVAREVLALDRQALDGWPEGNPDPMLAIADADITCIHAPRKGPYRRLCAERQTLPGGATGIRA
jgi:hypothetical protein